MNKMLVIIVVSLSLCFAAKPPKKVKTGAELLFEQRSDLIEGKRIAVITNHTAVLPDGRHLVDALFEYKKTSLVALFGPEHGVRGDAPDGRTVRDTIDEKTGVPVYSLYGRINKPTPEMLNNVEVLIFDIQDVGARFYTFISTMLLGMEAAAENNIHFVVLDRPNPITGRKVQGPLRIDSLKTFVGWVPIPIAHGLTVGELAVMANTSGWLKERIKAKLTVVKMENWKRTMWFEQTKLPWISPSPNMKSVNTAVVYPGMCLIEGINVSEGRGTELPFEQIGAPWIDGKLLAKQMNTLKLPGVTFEQAVFTPEEIPNVTSNPKYNNLRCEGIRLRITNRNNFQAVRTGIAVVHKIHALFKDSLKFRERGFDRLAGTPLIREGILSGKSVNEIESSWSEELRQFEAQRKKSILYLGK